MRIICYIPGAKLFNEAKIKGGGRGRNGYAFRKSAGETDCRRVRAGGNGSAAIRRTDATPRAADEGGVGEEPNVVGLVFDYVGGGLL